MPKYLVFRLNPVKPGVTPQNWLSSKVGRGERKTAKNKTITTSKLLSPSSPLKGIYMKKTVSLIERRNIFLKLWYTDMKMILKQQFKNRTIFKKCPLPSEKLKKCPSLSKHTYTPNFFCPPNDAIITSKIFDHSAHLNLEIWNLHKNGEKMFSKNLDVKF